ncbi:ABC transporter permease [Fulvivirga lutimaris]|uniref:ABC transporter permease n=1 Tax=Fulvivirga lutimaris TaxID=1819566 RepID=UPI0012BCACEF|nr:ABC transporter permease [Fulvivirga lutimaris]MTI41831.1 FtsX-like permease family protein [Fulvivirga lutimaris]
MFFKIALRNLLKRKVYTLINVSGLGIGLAACLTIFLFVKDELNYDKFYPNADNIYRIVRESGVQDDKSSHAVINYKLGELVKENLSQVTMLTQFSQRNEVKVKVEETVFNENNTHFTDNQFFQVFGVDFLEGNKEEALLKPNQVVITEEVSKKVFNDQSAYGKVLSINDIDYEVVGVVNEFPKNAHLHFDYLMSIETTRQIYGESMFEHWGNIWIYTYAVVTDGVNAGELDQAINQMALANGPTEVLNNFNVKFFSQPVSDIHLHSSLSSEMEKNGDFQLVVILVAVAVLILIIACFNFINLSTARSMWRAKEVGVKKILGIRKGNLIKQFLGESMLITTISFLFGMVLITLILPFFNNFTGKELSFSDLLMALPVFVLLILFVGLAAGAFPAFIMSSFEPLKIIKGKSSFGNSKIAGPLRQLLVIFQFTIAVMLIVCAIVIYQQLNFIKSKDLGTNIDNVLVLNLKNKNVRSNIDALENSILQVSGVTSVAATSDLPFEGLNSWRVKTKEGGGNEELINVLTADEKYFSTLDIKWSEQMDKPELDDRSIIVNEAFVKHFYIENPIGKELVIGHIEEPVQIVGVVSDFHYESLHAAIKPLMMYELPSWYRKLVVRLQDNESNNTYASIEQVWKNINPDDPIDYYYLEDKFSSLYDSEEKSAKMISYFSILAIFIACLGLYGLAAFMAETRLKEISVRKVLGASLRELVTIQYKVFFKLIIVAGIMGIPMAIALTNNWLNGFAYRVDFQEWVIVLALGILLFSSLISVGYSSLKAASSNPADNLRVE